VIRWQIAAALALLAGVLGTTSAAGPDQGAAPPKKPAAQAIFDEDFKTLPFERFKRIERGPSSEAQFDLNAGTATVRPGALWVRPGFAGFTADYTVDLTFPPLARDGDRTETHLGLVLSDRTGGVVRLLRERKDGKTGGSIDLLKQTPGPKGDVLQTLRHFPQPADLADGVWSIHYHHGVVLAKEAGKEAARGYLEADGAAVLGVTWEQIKGPLTCRHMRLDGVLPPAQSKEDQARLQEAARLNDEGMKLYREGKAAEALVPTRKASDVYLKVLGEMHHDSANSFVNMATLLEKTNQPKEARAFYQRALKVRQQVLGATHPGAGLVLFQLGNLMLAQGQRDEARSYYARCLPIYEQAYGKDHTLTRALADTLSRLQP
jgi:hypothetical protein